MTMATTTVATPTAPGQTRDMSKIDRAELDALANGFWTLDRMGLRHMCRDAKLPAMTDEECWESIMSCSRELAMLQVKSLFARDGVHR